MGKAEDLGLLRDVQDAAKALHKLWEKRENFPVYTSYGLVVSRARETELLLIGWLMDDDRES